jgi:hypothetical protein
MADAVFKSPLHEGEQVQRFTEMSKDDDYEAPRTEGLYEKRDRLALGEQHDRTDKEQAGWHQGEESFEHGGLFERCLAGWRLR